MRPLFSLTPRITPLLRTFRATADSAVLAAILRLEGFSQSGIETATFRLMAQRLHQLRHLATDCPLLISISGNIRFTGEAGNVFLLLAEKRHT